MEKGKEKKKGKSALRNVRLMERDRDVLFLLDKLGYASVAEIMILCGFNGNFSCRRRLSLLSEIGLIKIDKYEGKNVYTNTSAGYAEIERNNAKVLERNQGTRHQLHVATVIAYLHRNENIPLHKIKSDRELRASFESLKGAKKPHIPDIVAEDNGVYAFEVELTSKTIERLKRNMQANAQRYKYQIWIVPKTRPNLKANIKKVAQELILDNYVQVIELEQITDYVHAIAYPEKKGENKKC